MITSASIVIGRHLLASRLCRDPSRRTGNFFSFLKNDNGTKKLILLSCQGSTTPLQGDPHDWVGFYFHVPEYIKSLSEVLYDVHLARALACFY